MAENYNQYNRPGEEGYQWKAPPGYLGPSAQEQGIAQGLGWGGPSQGFTQGMESIMGALGQGGGYSAVMPHLGKLAKFAMKGKQMGKDYETAATKKLQQTGQAAFKGIQSQMGGQGALGSTTHLGGLGDLGQRYGAERAQISATATQMGENAMMNRLGAGMQGLGQLGQLRSYEQMNALQGGQAMANLGMQQQGMEHGFNMDQLGVLGQQRNEPYQAAFDLWTSNQRAPKSGGAMPYVLGGLNAFAAGSGFGGWGGGFGGGGQGGGTPRYGPSQYGGPGGM